MRLVSYPNICWLHSPNVGLDDYAGVIVERPDMRIKNPKGIADEAVSDHVLAMLPALTRTDPLIVASRHGNDWARTAIAGAIGRSLAEMDVHVLGFGTIGRRLVRKIQGFGSPVTIYRREVEGDDQEWERFVRLSRLTECVGAADVIVNLLPNVSETRHCIDGRVLAAAKPGALFVNVGRGATVEESALVAALEGGRFGGAALDVFETEPLPSASPLWSHPAVILSPHLAGRLQDKARRQVEVFLQLLADS